MGALVLEDDRNRGCMGFRGRKGFFFFLLGFCLVVVFSCF